MNNSKFFWYVSFAHNLYQFGLVIADKMTKLSIIIQTSVFQGEMMLDLALMLTGNGAEQEIECVKRACSG